MKKWNLRIRYQMTKYTLNGEDLKVESPHCKDQTDRANRPHKPRPDFHFAHAPEEQKKLTRSAPLKSPNKKAGRSGGGFERPVWRSPPGRRQTFTLHRRRLALASRRRSGRLTVLALRVRHKANIHAAIVGTAGCSFIRLYRLVLAQSDDINLVRGHVVLRGQVLDHGIGAALAQIVVVIGRTDGVTSALQRDNLTLRARDAASELIECFFGLRGEVVFVETELHRGLR